MTSNTAKEFVISIENTPGALAEIANALGKANVDITGFLMQAQGDFGVARIITSDPGKAEAWLKTTRHAYRTNEVVTAPVRNAPGEFGLVAEKLARSGINIEAAYPMAANGTDAPQIAFSVSDAQSALKAIN